MKSTYQQTAELTKANNLAFIQQQLAWGTNDEVVETVVEFVAETSTSFAADIAKRSLGKSEIRVSEKQAWVIAYEFFNIQDKFSAWADSK